MIEQPRPWDEITQTPEYGKMGTMEKMGLFSEWEGYARQYAQEQGLWDDEGFRKQYRDNATEVLNGFRNTPIDASESGVYKNGPKTIGDMLLQPPAAAVADSIGFNKMGDFFRQMSDRLNLGTQQIAPQAAMASQELAALGGRAMEPMTNLVGSVTGKDITGALRKNFTKPALDAADYYANKSKELDEAGQAIGGGAKTNIAGVTLPSPGDLAQMGVSSGAQTVRDMGLAMMTGGEGAAAKVIPPAKSVIEGAIREFMNPGVQRMAAISGASQGVMQENQARQDYQDKGDNQFVAQLRALPEASLTGLSTYLITALGGTSGVESVFKEKGPEGLREAIKEALLKEAPSEALEETGDQSWQDLWERAYRNPDKPYADTLSEIATAGILGGGMGFGFSSVNGVLNQPKLPGSVPATQNNLTPPPLPSHIQQAADNAEQNYAPKVAEVLKGITEQSLEKETNAALEGLSQEGDEKFAPPNNLASSTTESNQVKEDEPLEVGGTQTSVEDVPTQVNPESSVVEQPRDVPTGYVPPVEEIQAPVVAPEGEVVKEPTETGDVPTAVQETPPGEPVSEEQSSTEPATPPTEEPVVKDSLTVEPPAQNGISKFLSLVAQKGLRLLSPRDPGAFKMNGDSFPTLTNESGTVKVALDRIDIFEKDGKVVVADGTEPLNGAYVVQAVVTDPDARGKGEASAMMRKIIAMADEAGIGLKLEPTQMKDFVKRGQKSRTNEQLVAWYKNLGFVQQKEGSDKILYRPPIENTTTETSQQETPEGESQEEKAGEVTPETPFAKGTRVRLGKSPQVHVVEELIPQTPADKERGEQYVRLRNERNGNEVLAEVQMDKVAPVKGKVPSQKAKVSSEKVGKISDKTPVEKVAEPVQPKQEPQHHDTILREHGFTDDELDVIPEEEKKAIARSLTDKGDPGVTTVPTTGQPNAATDEERKGHVQALRKLGLFTPGQTAQVILRRLAKDAENLPEIARKIAEELLKGQFNDVKFRVINNPENNYAGYYDPRDNTIVINMASKQRGSVSQTLLHEFGHDFTLEKIRNPEGLNDIQKKALQNLQDLYERAKSLATKEQKEQYGLSSLEEFVTELYSDPEFNKFLKKLRAADNSPVSIFSKVWNSIANLIRGKTVDVGSLWDDAIRNAFVLSGVEGYEPTVNGGALEFIGSDGTIDDVVELVRSQGSKPLPQDLTTEQTAIVNQYLVKGEGRDTGLPEIAVRAYLRGRSIDPLLYDDLLSAAREGLVYGARRYSPEKGRIEPWLAMNAKYAVQKEAGRQYRHNARFKKTLDDQFGEDSETTKKDLVIAPVDREKVDQGAVDLGKKILDMMNLTDREREILDLRAETDENGKQIWSTRKIGQKLGVSHEIISRALRSIADRAHKVAYELGVNPEELFPAEAPEPIEFRKSRGKIEDDENTFDDSLDEAEAEFQSDLLKEVDERVVEEDAEEGKVDLTDKNGTTVIGPAAFSIPASHGTPYKIPTEEGFRLDKIGTGEGAQVEGYGFYFAQNPLVSEEYKNRLRRVDSDLPNNTEAEQAARDALDHVFELSRVTDGATLKRRAIDRLRRMGESKEAINLLRSLPDEGVRVNGNVYTVSIDAEPEDMIDLDKPLSEQSPKVQGLLGNLKDAYDQKVKDLQGRPVGAPGSAARLEQEKGSGRLLYKLLVREKGSPKAASEYLRSIGIPGMRFLDQGSRVSGKGTYNYVIFDPSKIKITHENGKDVRVAFSPAAEKEDLTFPAKRTLALQGIPRKTFWEKAREFAKGTFSQFAKRMLGYFGDGITPVVREGWRGVNGGVAFSAAPEKDIIEHLRNREPHPEEGQKRSQVSGVEGVGHIYNTAQTGKAREVIRGVFNGNSEVTPENTAKAWDILEKIESSKDYRDSIEEMAYRETGAEDVGLTLLQNELQEYATNAVGVDPKLLPFVAETINTHGRSAAGRTLQAAGLFKHPLWNVINEVEASADMAAAELLKGGKINPHKPSKEDNQFIDAIRELKNILQKIKLSPEEIMEKLSKFRTANGETLDQIVKRKTKYDPDEFKKIKAELKALRKKIAADALRSATRRGSSESVMDRIERVMIRNSKSLWGRYKDTAVKDLFNKLIGNGDKKKPAAVQVFTNRLVKQLKEILPKPELRGETGKTSEVTEAQAIGEAIRNFDKYKQVWEEAQAYVQEQFRDNPEALQSLDEYLGQILNRPFSDESVRRALQNEIDKVEKSLREILISSPEDKAKLTEEAANAIIKEAGVSGEDARVLGEAVADAFTQMMNEERGKMAKSLARQATPGVPKSKGQRLRELDNAGLLTEENFLKVLGIDNNQAELKAESGPSPMANLIQKILATPLSKQSTEGWQKQTAIDYFKEIGLNDSEAEKAATVFANAFRLKMVEAQEKAAKQFLGRTNAPWNKVEKKRIIKRQSDMVKMLKAIRTGALNSTNSFVHDLAKEKGWEGFTPGQLERMKALDEIISDENTPSTAKIKATQELSQIVRDAKIPASVIEALPAYYIGQALSGIPTLTVQVMSPIYFKMQDLFTDAIRSAHQARSMEAVVNNLSAFSQSFGDYISQLAFAVKNDVYMSETNELLSHNGELKKVLESGLKDFQTGIKTKNNRLAAKGVAKIMVSWVDYTRRLLSALDQGTTAVNTTHNTARYAMWGLREQGYSEKQISDIMQAAADTRMSATEGAKQAGYPPEEASIIGQDAFRKYWIMAAEKGGLNSQEISRAAEYDALAVVGRNAKGEDGEKVENEGTVLRIFRKQISNLSKESLSAPWWEKVMLKVLYGFFAIPSRVVDRGMDFSPVGLLRYHSWKRAAEKGNANPYAQSYATEAQAKQHLYEAIAGTMLMLMFAGLRSSSSDDDDDKRKNKPVAIYTTGAGPKNGPYRDAWLKSGHRPYSLEVRVGDMIVPVVNVGRSGEAMLIPFLLSAARDDWDIQQKSKKGGPGKVDRGLITNKAQMWSFLLGSYISGLALRGPLAPALGLSEKLGQKGYNPASTTDKLIQTGAWTGKTFIPVVGASLYKNFEDLFTNLPDRSSLRATTIANTPVARIFANKQINMFGEPIKDQGLSSKITGLGVPVVPNFPDSGPNAKLYRLIVKFGDGPSEPSRSNIEEKHLRRSMTDKEWADYAKAYGRIVSQRMMNGYSMYDKMKPRDYSQAMDALSRESREKALREVFSDE